MPSNFGGTVLAKVAVRRGFVLPSVPHPTRAAQEKNVENSCPGRTH